MMRSGIQLTSSNREVIPFCDLATFSALFWLMKEFCWRFPLALILLTEHTIWRKSWGFSFTVTSPLVLEGTRQSLSQVINRFLPTCIPFVSPLRTSGCLRFRLQCAVVQRAGIEPSRQNWQRCTAPNDASDNTPSVKTQKQLVASVLALMMEMVCI